MYPGRVTPEFQRQGWEVHGIALEGSRVAESFRAAGVEPLTFRSRTAALFGVRKVLRYLKQHDIRVMHAHKSSDMRLGALLVSLWPELRLFFTDHMGVKKPKKDLYHRWAYAKLRRLFAISKVTHKRNQIAFPLSADRIQQLYYGIDLSAYELRLSDDRRAEIRQSMGAPQNAVLIALPGRVSEGKGHARWVEALKCLSAYDELPNWCAVIIGEPGAKDARPGGFADQLNAQIVRSGLSGHVIFAGYRDDLADCLKAVDIVCIPSFNEAFGLSVIEAMAAGRPVVGSDAGAIPELVSTDRGRLAPPYDPIAWASALAELLSDSALRERLGENAAEWVRNKFGMSLHVEALANAYQAIDP